MCGDFASALMKLNKIGDLYLQPVDLCTQLSGTVRVEFISTP